MALIGLSHRFLNHRLRPMTLDIIDTIYHCTHWIFFYNLIRTVSFSCTHGDHHRCRDYSQYRHAPCIDIAYIGVHYIIPYGRSMKLLIFGHDRATSSNPYCVARIYFPTVGRVLCRGISHTWSSFISVTIPLARKYLANRFLGYQRHDVVNTRLQVVVVNRQKCRKWCLRSRWYRSVQRTYIRCPWQKCIQSAWNQGSSLFPLLFIIPIQTRVIIR
jgi:hypothetical protein